ncbi:hypothetical protein LCGC14_1092060 [marine sediment metagenome]|uniref:Uncharacterized protein n=1 Tax=marine sediment metagenome TaxID=412755 RepID=A0A0F9MZT6_9ZZZZ
MPEESTASRAIRSRMRDMLRKRADIEDELDVIYMMQSDLEVLADRVAELVVCEVEVDAALSTPRSLHSISYSTIGSLDCLQIRIPSHSEEKDFVGGTIAGFKPLIEAAIIAEMVKRQMLEPDMEKQPEDMVDHDIVGGCS